MLSFLNIMGLYSILGILSGTLSGLFGVGGGVIIVPTLLFSFKLLGISENLYTHMAIGTSLCTIFVIVSSSAYFHMKQTPIDTKIFLKLLIPICLGSLLGSSLSNTLPPQTLKIIFSIYILFVAYKMWHNLKIKSSPKKTSLLMYLIVGSIIGIKSSLLGIGGGTISIPFLSWRGLEMKKAIGVSVCIGIPIALIGGLASVYNGFSKENLPLYSWGYLYLPAFLGIITTGPFFARIGVKLSYSLPQKKIKKGFSLFLVLIAIKTFFAI